MRRSSRISPLTVQFWLLGLDAADGSLLQRGFQKVPAAQGSSRYRLGALELHSSGLRLQTAQGELTLLRRPGRFALNGQPLAAHSGLRLCAPELLAHEAWVAQRRGPQWRRQQLAGYRLPPTIRRAVPLWEAYLQQHGGLRAQLWLPGGLMADGGRQMAGD